MSFEDIHNIHNLMAQYCYNSDTGQADRQAMLFTRDGSLLGPFGEAHGREALQTFYDGAAEMSRNLRHFTTNIQIHLDQDSATARSYVMVTNQSGDTPAMMFTGVYIDRLRREDGAWRFAERRIGVSPAEFDAPELAATAG